MKTSESADSGSSVASAGPSNEERLKPRLAQRMREREAWDAYWQVRDMETRGTWWYRFQYKVWRLVDTPATWFRGTVPHFYPASFW